MINKRFCILFLFLLPLSHHTWSQTKLFSPLNGSVKFVLEESFGAIPVESGLHINGKDRQISWINDNKMEFDLSQNLLKRSFYDDLRNFIHAESYSYVNNKLISKTISSFIYTYTYDQNGSLLTEMVAPKLDSTSRRLKYKYSYNEQKMLTDIWEFDYNGGHICHEQKKYNSNGKTTSEILNYKDGKETKIYTYDSNNELVKLEWFDNKNILLERTNYTHVDGHLIREFWEGFSKNTVETTLLKEYDKHGNPIKIVEIDEKRQINDNETSEYEFDSHNNWIRKMTTINNSRFYIVVRRIGYY